MTLKFGLLELMDETKQAGDAEIRCRAYVPDRGEDDNDLPCLFSIEWMNGDRPTKWTLLPYASEDRLILTARERFNYYCGDAEAEYRDSERARADARLADAHYG